MEATREQMKAEAVSRMRAFGIINDAIQQFKRDDVVMVSERGILYWLDEKQKQYVKKFEEEYNTLVYMVIHNRFEFGECLSMVYVSSNMDTWEYDREDMKDGIVFAYVENLDDPLSSESGTIGVRNRFGGLIRTS